MAPPPPEPDLLRTVIIVGGLGAMWCAVHALCSLLLRPIFLKLLLNNPKLAAQPEKREKVSHMLSPRLVCFVHNVVQVPLALVVLNSSRYKQDKALAQDDFSTSVMAISAGYFLYDTLECLVNFKSEGPAFLTHGVACLLVYGGIVHTRVMHWFGAGFLLWELSTPFLHLRWLLIQIGMGSTRAFDLVQKGGFLVFFLVRIAWGYYATVLFWKVSFEVMRDPLSAKHVPLLLLNTWRSFSVLLNGLNTYWFSSMMRIALAPPPAAAAVSVVSVVKDLKAS